MFPGGPPPPNNYNPYGPPLPNTGNYTPPGAGGGAPPPPGYTGGPPSPPMGWPPNLPWQGQPPGLAGNYGGYTPPSVAGGGGGGAGGGGGGTPAGDLWNGYTILMRGPGGNVLVDYNGVPTAFDAYGNLISHLGVGYTSADPNAGPAPAEQPPAPPPAAPGVAAPGPSGPPTFYAPTTGSPYLQLGQNFLGYLDPTMRSQLNDQLLGAGFGATGTGGLYGPSDYLRPANFSASDVNAITQNETLRNWLQFFLGNYGYGISYQLPGDYAGGIPQSPTAPSLPPLVPHT